MPYRVIPGGASSSRVFLVDAGGNGDHKTIQAALNAAHAQSPSASLRWLVLIGPGVYPRITHPLRPCRSFRAGSRAGGHRPGAGWIQRHLHPGDLLAVQPAPLGQLRPDLAGQRGWDRADPG